MRKWLSRNKLSLIEQSVLTLVKTNPVKERINLIFNMIKDEQEYVSSIQDSKALIGKSNINSTTLKNLVESLDQIVHLSSDFILKLKNYKQIWPRRHIFGEILLEMIPKFQIYHQYTNHFTEAQQFTLEQGSYPQLNSDLLRGFSILEVSLSHVDYYENTVEKILYQTEKTHQDFANIDKAYSQLKAMNQSIKAAKEIQKKGKNMKLLEQLSNLFNNMEKLLVDIKENPDNLEEATLFQNLLNRSNIIQDQVKKKDQSHQLRAVFEKDKAKANLYSTQKFENINNYALPEIKKDILADINLNNYYFIKAKEDINPLDQELDNLSESQDSIEEPEPLNDYSVYQSSEPSYNQDSYAVNFPNKTSSDMYNIKKSNENIRTEDLIYSMTEKTDLSPLYSTESDEEEKSVKSSEDTDIDWNTRLQDILAQNDSLEKFSNTAILAKDFLSVAQQYGKIIIAEQFLPIPNKTVKPVGIGGVAGGTKYISRNILFKFTLDSYQAFTQSWLYGGKTENHEKAMKAACNELKGLSAIYLCNILGLIFPLMTLIHYRGYCLLAVGILPLKELLYGSNDGGRTVHSDPKVRQMMLKVGKILNLEEHLVGSGAPIIGPGDIEVHLALMTDIIYWILEDCFHLRHHLLNLLMMITL